MAPNIEEDAEKVKGEKGKKGGIQRGKRLSPFMVGRHPELEHKPQHTPKKKKKKQKNPKTKPKKKKNQKKKTQWFRVVSSSRTIGDFCGNTRHPLER